MMQSGTLYEDPPTNSIRKESHLRDWANYTNKLPRGYNLRNRVLHNDQWGKVVFVRDPLERFVSAWRNNFGNPSGHWGVSMSGFIRENYLMMLKGDKCLIHDHARPQICFCDMWRNDPNTKWDVYVITQESRSHVTLFANHFGKI